MKKNVFFMYSLKLESSLSYFVDLNFKIALDKTKRTYDLLQLLPIHVLVAIIVINNNNNKTSDSFERWQMQVVPINDKRNERRDPLYSLPTVRNETRVTSERQDDIMNYKMTVKAKVSSGFADLVT